MSLFFYKIIAGIIIFGTSLVAIIYPIRLQKKALNHFSLQWADAFASGIFLGLALFHMLPAATRGYALRLPTEPYPLAELFCAGGFLLLLLLERMGQSAEHQPGKILPYLLASILMIHGFIEGAALGINATVTTALVIFIAIVAHKSSESFALAMLLHKAQFSMDRMIKILVLFALMTPLGISVGALLVANIQFTNEHTLVDGFNAFAAGSFLYMSTVHHVNRYQGCGGKQNMLEFLCLLLGLVVMAVIACWL